MKGTKIKGESFQDRSLIKQMRELVKEIEKAEQVKPDEEAEAREQVMRVHAQFAHMIETYPKIYGPNGSKRNWLVARATEYGLDDDWMPSDEGPYNQPNE